MFTQVRTRLALVLFTLFFCFSTMVSSSLISTDALATDDRTFTPRQVETYGLLAARATGTTLCYPLRISLTTTPTTDPDNNSTIIPRTCYCQVTGILTSDSASFLDSALASGGSANQTAFQRYLTTNGLTRAQGIANLKTSIQNALNTKTTTCVYPANSIPSSCDACTYDCASGYKVCGTTCVANSVTCKSGVPVKRELEQKVCPQGYSACSTTYLGSRGGDGWECLNTSNDLESCGGCQFPLADGVAGVDCTAILGTSVVGCVQGQCIVSTCLRGWILEDNKCVKALASPAGSTTSRRGNARRRA